MFTYCLLSPTRWSYLTFERFFTRKPWSQTTGSTFFARIYSYPCFFSYFWSMKVRVSLCTRHKFLRLVSRSWNTNAWSTCKQKCLRVTKKIYVNRARFSKRTTKGCVTEREKKFTLLIVDTEAILFAFCTRVPFARFLTVLYSIYTLSWEIRASVNGLIKTKLIKPKDTNEPQDCQLTSVHKYSVQ